MKTVIANWKANPTTLAEAQELFDFYLSEISKYQNIQFVVCPPFVYLEELAQKLAKTNMGTTLHIQHAAHVSLGAQNLFWEKSGSHTGEISTDMLKSFSVTHVLVGHSDRRYKIGETDEIINKKVKAALEADIMPILLVGEQKRGDDRKKTLEDQLAADLNGLTADEVSKVLITYEPVWAISTQPDAQPDTPESTLEAIRIINDFLAKRYTLKAIRYLYGGSVNQTNVASFLSNPEISGAVIGGASLKKEEFGGILKIVSELHD